jgi:hypothetical protein
MNNPDISSGILTMFYAWQSMAANALKPKDFGIKGSKYEFRQLRSYKWRYTDDPGGDFVELSKTPVVLTAGDYTYSFFKLESTPSNPDWTPEAFSVLFEYETTDPAALSGGTNLDFRLFSDILSYSFTLTGWPKAFDIILSSTFQYKLQDDTSWTDCPAIADLFETKISSINNQVDNYTLALTDINKLVDVSCVDPKNLIVPADSDVNFPLFTEIKITTSEAGTITVTPSEGVTINALNNLKKLSGASARAYLLKTDINTWLLSGNLKA